MESASAFVSLTSLTVVTHILLPDALCISPHDHDDPSIYVRVHTRTLCGHETNMDYAYEAEISAYFASLWRVGAGSSRGNAIGLWLSPPLPDVRCYAVVPVKTATTTKMDHFDTRSCE